MVKLSASYKVIGAATILAGATSAVPMGRDYGAGAASASYAYGASSSTSAAASYQTAAAAVGQYGSQYGSAGNSYGSGSGMSMSMMAPPQYTSSAAPPAYTSSSYGSGSVSWNSGSYDNCVQQCVAQFGAPSSMYLPPSMTDNSDNSDAGSVGTGATHTVWVAPTQGVLRYVPFSVDAAIGDTVKFIWGANVHTVTKSSQLDICNKTGEAPFASGIQNKTFVFTQVVNDTNPTFYYCGVPTHCQKGMFGIINPPSAPGQPGSVGMMLPTVANSTAATQAGWSYMTNITSGQPAAAAWGNNIDMSQMPSWSQSYVAENVMYSKSFFALNPAAISQNGTVNLSPLAAAGISLPTDVAAAVRLSDNSTATSSSSGAAPSSTSKKSNGAGALSSPRVAVALVAVVAAFFAL
jgi:plastocyanin